MYIREAHALDGFLPRGGEGQDPLLEDPVSLEERFEVARQCADALELDGLPAVVDTLDDATSRAYDAWPDRLYLIDAQGLVAYQGGPGPDEFDPDGLEAAIVAELNEPGSLARSGPEVSGRSDSWSEPDSRGAAPASDELRYRCGDRMLSLADANDYHSRLFHWWDLDLDRVRVYSTCGRATASRALGIVEAMTSSDGDLARIFGQRSGTRIGPVILLRNLEQYNAFSILRPEQGRVPPEVSNISGVHYAYPCESWVELRDHGVAIYSGAACAYWDARSQSGDAWGPFAVRHAAAHVYAEALDPAREAVIDRERDPFGEFDAVSFWSRRSIPLWLRYGAASYVERFFVDDAVESPRQFRDWSLQELVGSDGFATGVREVLAFRPSAVETARSRTWLLEVGALVAFVLDGDVAPVVQAHSRFRAAVKVGSGVREAASQLEQSLIDAESELLRFVDR